MSILTANEHFQAGREALRLAKNDHSISSGVLEDLIYDPEQLQRALKHLNTAASLFKSEGRATDEAYARIDLAEVYVNMRPTKDTCDAAETNCRIALNVLDTAEDPVTCLKAYSLLVMAMKLLIELAPKGIEKERSIKRTLGVLRAAEHLAKQQEDQLLRASLDDTFSRVLGAKFHGDRDSNLLDAIRIGQRALPVFRQAHARSPLSYSSLQVHLGNCYMKLDGSRKRWLEAGLCAYKDGLAAVNPLVAPRLHRILTENAAMTEALIAEGDNSLPEMEMFGRFGGRLQSVINDGDIDGALAITWETIQWAWSINPAPNVWVAEAHKQIGSLLLHKGDAGGARDHFYSAVALLSALDKPGGGQQAALLRGARQLLEDAMTSLGNPQQMDELIQQADSAFINARNHCAYGSQLLADDPKSAYDEFEEALVLFPYDPLALFYRGMAYISFSNPEAALHDFDEALGLQPRSVHVLTNRALVKVRLGDANGALTDYAAVLDIDPQNHVALYNSSIIRVAAGDYKAAMNDLDRLIEANPCMTAASTLRTECLERLGRSGST